MRQTSQITNILRLEVQVQILRHTAGLRLLKAIAINNFPFHLPHTFVIYCVTQPLFLYLSVNATTAWVESIASKEDSLNIAAIVIGVIAVVIIAGLIVVIIFLLKKIRGLKKERLDSQCKFSLGKLDGKKYTSVLA